MIPFKPFSLNIKGVLKTFEQPCIMGILNVTSDSFYSASRAYDDETILANASLMLDEGADWIDIGGFSSRPGAGDVDEKEEINRVIRGIRIVRDLKPDTIISVDTFRSNVAIKAVEAGADIINDISGGDLDPEMIHVIPELNVPYVLMHMRGNPSTMTSMTNYNDVTGDVLAELRIKVEQFSHAGVNDIIIDPGFGFAKTVEQNYSLMRHLELFHIFEMPLLVGISRKSMIYKLLGTTPAEALNGTIVLNTVALLDGASVLRVHDVKAAVEARTIIEKTYNS